MTSRRQFIKTTIAAAGTLPFSSSLAIPPSKETAVILSTWNFGLQTNEAGWNVFRQGGAALDAVEAGAREAENDLHSSSVGLAGRPDREGITTLDACIMDHEYNCGSVCFLEKIKNPISVARRVMERTPHIMLAGSGAQQFALEQGFELNDYVNPESEKAWKEWLKTSDYKPVINIENHDTIGVIALDIEGRLAGACSTSGVAYKMRGRVGDSPIIGAGLYVDGEAGACVATGLGEEVIRMAGAHLVVEKMRDGYTPEEACRKAVERIVAARKDASQHFQIGMMAISRTGQYGAWAVQPGFQYAVHNERENVLVNAESYYKG